MSQTQAQLVGNVVTGAVFAGIVTATSLSIGDSVEINSEGINVTGIITATSFVGSGSGLTGVGIGTTGSVNTSGIITATGLSGNSISIGPTAVIDSSRNIINTVNITASGSISGGIVATQAQAQAGTDNTKLMTPLRVAQAIATLGGNVINRIQRGSTSYASPIAPSPGPAAFVPSFTVNVPITSVNTAKAFVSGNNIGNWGTVPGGPSFTLGVYNSSAAAKLTSATNIQINTAGYRLFVSPGGAAPQNGVFDWEVIEFK
jgi:hypothetical protein